MTLEELDVVFNIGNREHSKYYTEKLPWYVSKYIMRREVEPFEPLCQVYDDEGSSSIGNGDEKKQSEIA